MLEFKNNVRVECKPQSIPPEASIMPGITTTVTTTTSRTSSSKQLLTVSKPVAIPPTVDFPTKKTPTRHLFRTPITITTGPESHPFPVHLEVLLTTSRFFTAAYNPRYSFGDSPSTNPTTTSPTATNPSSTTTANYNNLNLPTVSPTDFEFFIQWLYTRTLDHEDLDGPHPAYFKLIRLYQLADQLQVTALKNSLVDEIAIVADRTNSCPTPDDTRVVWDDESGCGSSDHQDRMRLKSEEDRTDGKSEGGEVVGGASGGAPGVGAEEGGLRDLISDLFVWKKTDRLIEEHVDQWDERFLREVVVKLKREKAKGMGIPWRDRGRACRRYHVHDEWAPMCEGIARGE